jgi:ParB/Sulfiredoxin domain
MDDLDIPAFLDRRPKRPTLTIEEIPISRVRDAGAQVRAGMHDNTICDYADNMLDGVAFPPIVLFHDGTDYWLADGYHRLEAAKRVKLEKLAAEVRKGIARDAILYGIGANASHGLRRTQADKRLAVERLLRDPEWSQMSDRKLAAIAKVDHKTVGKIRLKLMAGEIPTLKAQSSKLANASCHADGRPQAIAPILRSIPDDLLIAECRRRRLVISNLSNEQIKDAEGGAIGRN